MPKKQPRFKHDCIQCHLLDSDKSGDWYVCGTEGDRSVIRRYASEGAHYESLAIGGHSVMTPLVRAAIAHGLTLTEQEVRSLLGDLLTQDMPMRVYELTSEIEDDDLGSLIRATVRVGMG
jgi:hypothetical protein